MKDGREFLSAVFFCFMTIEEHPLQPFLPDNGTVLFLGSFPPPKVRWSMEFFYPNFINDFWRIMGLIFFDNKDYFILPGCKKFDKQLIVAFANKQGLAFYDTASKVNRLKDNASDNFLEILEPTDIGRLLVKMPSCNRLVTTGGKASEELLRQVNLNASAPLERMPLVGEFVSFQAWGRNMQWWRMPSSSRAYPLSLDKKAAQYAKLF